MSVSKRLDSGQSVLFTPTGSFLLHEPLLYTQQASAIPISRVGDSFKITLNSGPRAKSSAHAVTTDSSRKLLLHLHRCFGSVSSSRLHELLTASHIAGRLVNKLPAKLAPGDLAFIKDVSAVGHQARARDRAHFDLRGVKHFTVPYTHLHADTKGPLPVASFAGNRYAHFHTR